MRHLSQKWWVMKHSFRLRIGNSLDICVCGLSSVIVGSLRCSVRVRGGRGRALLELVLETRAHQLELVVLRHQRDPTPAVAEQVRMRMKMKT